MIVADTGPLFAALAINDRRHGDARAFLAASREVVLVPGPVIGEVCYLAHRRIGSVVEAAFVRQLGGGTVQVENLTPADYLRAADLIEQYADFPIGFVDAAVVAVAERHGVRRVLTFDRRHFGAIRPQHCAAFELVP